MDLTERTPIKTNITSLLWIVGTVIGLTAAGVVGWMSVKQDIADHAKQLVAVQATVTADHDIGVAHTAQIQGLANTLDRIEHKLDRIPRVPEVITTTTKTETTSHPP